MPCVDDFTLAGREEQDTVNRAAIRSQTWFIAVHEPATAHEPLRVLTTATQLPSTSHAVAAVDGYCIARRAKRAGRSHVWVAAIDFMRGARWKVPTEDAVPATERHAPAGGSIGARDFLDNANEGQWVGFLATD